MHRELKVAFGMFFFIPLLYLTTLIPSSLFLNIKSSNTTIEGTVTLERKPLYDGIVLKFSEEVVTPGGYNCPVISGTVPFEERPDNTITYQLPEKMKPCLVEGAIHRATRQYLFFRPIITENVIENL